MRERPLNGHSERGGSAWESNPPRRASRRATGFEDQEAHRGPTAPVVHAMKSAAGCRRVSGSVLAMERMTEAAGARLPCRGPADRGVHDRPAGRTPARGAGLVHARRRRLRLHDLARDGQGAQPRANDAVALVVQDERPPFDYVLVEGRAELLDDPAECYRIAAILGAKYMGPERAEEFAQRQRRPGRTRRPDPPGANPRLHRRRVVAVRDPSRLPTRL